MSHGHSCVRARVLLELSIIALLMIGPISAGAATVGYWRMEADISATPGLLEVANEMAGTVPGATNLFSTAAFIDNAIFDDEIPVTGAQNLGSIGSVSQGGNDGINASIGWYSALDVSSITLEFWARTPENTATLFSRTSGNNGIVIDNPRTLDISYWVDDGLGGSVERQLLDVHGMPGTWEHYAFMYDELTGIGEFWVDGVLVASRDDEDNRPLFWGSSTDIEVGRQMDFAAANNGTFDELRIDNRRLLPGEILITPEPGSGAMLALGLTMLAIRRRA